MRHTEEFADPDAAEDAFAKTEERFRGTAGVQVVLFSADSIASIQATHPHYFSNGAGVRDALPV